MIVACNQGLVRKEMNAKQLEFIAREHHGMKINLRMTAAHKKKKHEEHNNTFWRVPTSQRKNEYFCKTLIVATEKLQVDGKLVQQQYSHAY